MIVRDLPWLPDDADEEFDPVAYADFEIGEDVPMAVTPRGGAQEVGRSCYQVDTAASTFLVDCGLRQGEGGQFPDLRGLPRESIDGVFLTHAHIDHCGGLPVLENRGLFDEDATIVATRPTTQLAHMMLEDSLKLHQREAQRPGRDQRFNSGDVERVYDRFEPIDYEKGSASAYTAAPDRESLMFEFGNASHLLGSAWISLEAGGQRVVFSGDLGGRSPYLPDIDHPQQADMLFIESTYGATHSHTATKTAHQTLFDAIERAVTDQNPVLLPTFSIGRAQLLLYLFSTRLHELPGHVSDRIQIVLDGMAQDATNVYHSNIHDETYFSESLINYTRDSGIDQPFLPEGTRLPDSDNERQQILDEFDPHTGENTPLIIAPSGMLAGGHSPRYLGEMIGRYDDASIILTGYQAQDTPGRTLSNAASADAQGGVTTTITAGPFGPTWPDSQQIAWITDEETGERVTRLLVPTDWITQIDGLSAHAAQDTLLTFTRWVMPTRVGVIHGSSHAQYQLSQHLLDNVQSVQEVTQPRMATSLPVAADTDIETPSMTAEETKPETIDDQFEFLFDKVEQLNQGIAEARNETGLTEAEIREIVRDEVHSLIAEADMEMNDEVDID